jgi:hypothetical protein
MHLSFHLLDSLYIDPSNINLGYKVEFERNLNFNTSTKITKCCTDASRNLLHKVDTAITLVEIQGNSHLDHV